MPKIKNSGLKILKKKQTILNTKRARRKPGKMKVNGGHSSRDNLAINLRILRAYLGITQDQLAVSCGFMRTYIGAIERCDINVGLENLDKIAWGVGVSAHLLISEPDRAQTLIRRELDQG